MTEESKNDDVVGSNKVVPLTKKETNPSCPIADENNTCSMADLVELYNSLHKISQMRIRSTVGFRINVSMNKIKNTIKAYQAERDKFIKEHGIKNKITGQKEIPISDKDMSSDEKVEFYKVNAEFTVLIKELTEQREPIPEGLRNFYISEETSDFPEGSGVLPVHFKALQDFGMVHEGEDPHKPKSKK